MKKSIACVLCFIAAAVCMTGCGNKKEQKNDGIHVCAGIDDQIMKNAVNIFKNTYPDIQVTVTEQEISDNSEELYEYGER